jgi:hypothetical protein
LPNRKVFEVFVLHCEGHASIVRNGRNGPGL